MKAWTLLLPALVVAIYKDQAGKYDWSVYNIGKVDYLAAVSTDNYFVTSERGVLAQLRSSGHLAWRRLPFGLDLTFETVSDESQALTWRENVLKQWRQFDGLMVRERAFPNEIVAAKLITYHSLKAIAVCQAHQVQIIDLSDGDVLRAFDFTGEVSGIIENEGEIGVVYLNKGVKIRWISEDSTDDVKLTDIKGSLLITSNTVAVLGEGKVIWQYKGKVYSQAWTYGNVLSVVPELDTFLTESKTVTLTSYLKPSSLCKAAASYGPELACLTKSAEGQISITFGTQTFGLQQFEGAAEVEKMWVVKGVTEPVYILRLADHTLTSFTTKEVKWTREEALGSITHLEIFDLPGKTVHAHNPYYERLEHHDEWADVFVNMYLRVQSQVANIISLLSSKDLLEQSQIRDAFGFNKIIVAATSANKLFGISSETGQVVWSRPLSKGSVISLTPLHLEEAAVVVKSEKGSTVIVINPVTGAVSTSVDINDYDPLHIVPLGDEHLSALLMIDNNLKPILLPDNTETRSLLKNKARFFYKIDKVNKRADGYKITPELILQQTWTLAFSPTESIEAYSSSRSGHLQQPAIATGFSAMLYKNTDDNLFAVATLQTRSTFRGHDTDLIIHLINGVTGQIIGKVRQEFASGPVNLLMDEYWAVACYWQYKSSRYEALSIELFEDEIAESATKVITDYYEGNRADMFSSYLKPAPKVLSRTYAMTTGVKALGSTQTLQGITKQYVLMIINSGQIYAIDHSLLSPRRKTEEEVGSVFDEANLPPYNAVLPMIHTNIINYDRMLEGLDSLKTTWTLLESTSILAAYGLDLFSSKVMPERTFDMLTEEFSYSAIIITIGLLLVLNIVGKRYFAMKEVDKRFNE
mmetsp:Transcript_13200/g.24714  ORF Transcript_13200/g.24714 Transcript_13200/m.24714 type:complete len:867 (+) Transcript_13200:1078-3678(+)